MSSGEGIPELIRLAQDSSSAGRANRTFAWQMLAQVSAFHPEASAALLAAARSDSIPGAGWPSVAEALAGIQYQIRTEEFDRTRSGFEGEGLKTYHIASGNQNYYSVTQAANWPPDRLEQRRGLINELLAASANPAAVQALRNAQTRLPGANNAMAFSTR
jgi:hypothetical protein